MRKQWFEYVGCRSSLSGVEVDNASSVKKVKGLYASEGRRCTWVGLRSKNMYAGLMEGREMLVDVSP